MKADQEEFPGQKISLTGPNELNDEDLGLEPDEETEFRISEAENNNSEVDDSDTMEDPENDLDEEEVGRLFPGMDDTDKDSDLEDLNAGI